MLWAIGCLLVVIGIAILVIRVVEKKHNDRHAIKEESQDPKLIPEQPSAKSNPVEENPDDDVSRQNEDAQNESDESQSELEPQDNPQAGQETEDKEGQEIEQNQIDQQEEMPSNDKYSAHKEELFLIMDEKVIPIGDVLRLGRSSGCDVVIEDPLVSRYHCKLGKVFGKYVIEDKHSTNGTLLNDKPVPEDEYKKIKSGDRITMGYTTLFIR